MASAAAIAAGRDKKNAQKLLGGGDTIRIGPEMLCLPYARFFLKDLNIYNFLPLTSLLYTVEEFVGEWCVAILFLDILVWVLQSANVKRFCVGFFFFEVATRQNHALYITHEEKGP